MHHERLLCICDVGPRRPNIVGRQSRNTDGIIILLAVACIWAAYYSPRNPIPMLRKRPNPVILPEAAWVAVAPVADRPHVVRPGSCHSIQEVFPYASVGAIHNAPLRAIPMFRQGEQER